MTAHAAHQLGVTKGTGSLPPGDLNLNKVARPDDQLHCSWRTASVGTKAVARIDPRYALAFAHAYGGSREAPALPSSATSHTGATVLKIIEDYEESLAA